MQVDNKEVKFTDFLVFERYKNFQKNEMLLFESLEFYKKNKKVRIS